MEKQVLLFLIAVFQLQYSVGQNPLVKQWDHRFGGSDMDILYSVQQTIDKGYILGGRSYSGIGGDKTGANWGWPGEDFWIVKTDSNGYKQWDRDFGGTSYDWLFDLQQTLDGGFIFGGCSRSDLNGDKTQPNWDTINHTSDYWIIKSDLLGNKQWDKRFGGFNSDICYAIQQTQDGGYILGGYSQSGIGGDKSEANFGSFDYWIVKVDSSGNKIWDKTFGGNDDDELLALKITNDGGFVLAGFSKSGIGGNKTTGIIGGRDYWIVKTDSIGNKLWEMDFGGYLDDCLSAIQQTNDGGYILGGFSHSPLSGNKTQNTWGATDYWIVKTDSSGNFVWDKDFGGNSFDEGLISIDQTNDHGYIIGGGSLSNLSGDKTQNNYGFRKNSWIVKTDSIGNKQWDKTLLTNGVHDDQAGITWQQGDGYYMVANYTDGGIAGDKTQTCQGNWDYWLVKFYANPVTFSTSDTIFCGKQYIDFYDHSTNSPTSWFWLFPGAVPSSSTQQNPTGIFYNSFGSFDVTLIACNAAGCDTLYLPNFIHEFPNPPVPVVTWVADTLFSTPGYAYQWYFNSIIIPGATDQYYVFQLQGNYFVVVSDSNGCSSPSSVIYTGMEEIAYQAGVQILPNPSTGDFLITGVPDNSIIKIYDTSGRLLISDFIQQDKQLHFSASGGVYFLEITLPQGMAQGQGSRIFRKMVKMD